jgi:glucose/mannose-6-phosphate isomerase
MSILDSPPLYEQLDPSGMLQHLRRFPEQCRCAWDNSARLRLPPAYTTVSKVVISGMGGSAIGGDFIRRLAALENSVPVGIHRDYGLPPFVDGNTLLIFSSYSGNTEETLSCFAESLNTEARKLVITTGGKLKEMARQEGLPVLTIDYASPPRAAFPHSFVSLLGVFNALGLIRDKTADFQEASQVLEAVSRDANEDVPAASNPAKQLAADLHGHLAVVYGAGLLTEVAQRWKTQLNENSKAWAFHENLPELNHNAVVGYQFPPEVGARTMVVLLHSSLIHRRVSVRYHLTQEILARQAIKHRMVEAQGRGSLAQMLGMVLLGDYVSLYLAILNRVDPTGVAQIDYLKSRLSES